MATSDFPRRPRGSLSIYLHVHVYTCLGIRYIHSRLRQLTRYSVYIWAGPSIYTMLQQADSRPFYYS